MTNNVTLPQNVRLDILHETPISLDQFIASEERAILLRYLREKLFNYKAVADELKITYRTMRYRCERAGLGLKSPNAKPIRRKQSAYDREFPRLRAIVLKRDKGRCQCCGATAKDGVRLHVDHIKPRSKYPGLALDLDNLQVLCEPCNLSKSNKDETNWRDMHA